MRIENDGLTGILGCFWQHAARGKKGKIEADDGRWLSVQKPPIETDSAEVFGSGKVLWCKTAPQILCTGGGEEFYA